MPAAQQDFTIEQGASWGAVLTYKNAAGVPRDLSGYTARMQVRASVAAPDVLLELATENGRIGIEPATGRVELSLDAATTGAIDWRRGVYDLEIEAPDGHVARLLEGRISVSREVTR